MSLGEASALLVSLGVGGVVGAALAVLAGGARLTNSWEAFSFVFRNYFFSRADPESQVAVQAFEELRASLDSLLGSVAKLRRALRLK